MEKSKYQKNKNNIVIFSKVTNVVNTMNGCQ